MKTQFAALALGVLLISAPTGTAPSGNHRARPCATAFLSAPGPVVDGRHRQPTAAEIEARTLALGQQNDMSAGSCRTAPGGRQEVLQGSRPNTAIGMSLVVAAAMP